VPFVGDPAPHPAPWLDRVLNAMAGHPDGMAESDEALRSLDQADNRRRARPSD